MWQELTSLIFMTKRRKKSKEKGVQVTPNNKNKSDAVITTIIAMLGIYVPTIFSLCDKGGDAITNFFEAQASLGGICVNVLVLIGVAYNKFSKDKFIYQSVYWWSMATFMVIAVIFAHSVHVVAPMVDMEFEFLGAKYIALPLHLLLFGCIYAVAAQKMHELQIHYNKVVL